jgi:hypothetical protein
MRGVGQESRKEKPARGRPPLKVDFAAIEQFLHLPQPEAAKALGISLTSLKLVCRKQGLNKWPYRRTGRNCSGQQADAGDSVHASSSGHGAAARPAATAPWYAKLFVLIGCQRSSAPRIVRVQ